MATLSFSSTGKKVFTPIPSALGQTTANPGTLIVLGRKETAGSADWAGITASGQGDWFHGLGQSGATFLDDDGAISLAATSSAPNDTTDWWWLAVDWPTTGTVRFHWRDHTTGGTWSHENSANSHTSRAGSGTGGWMNIGYIGDNSTPTRSIAVVGVWAGTRFSDSDYGTWDSTSDLKNHALGQPTFLCECTSTTPVDIMGGSTYDSLNSTNVALTGVNPPSFTFDGSAPVTIVEQYTSAMNSMKLSRAYL